MPFNIQGPELILILIIALVLIGPGKLPDVGSALGKSIREFRKAATDVKDATSVEPLPASSGSSSTVAPAAPSSAATSTVAASTTSGPPGEAPAEQATVQTSSEPRA
jgi:TatA/E family protein of Tat protein translocase